MEKEFYWNWLQHQFLNINEKLIFWKVPLINGYFKEINLPNSQKKNSLFIWISLEEPVLIELNLISEIGEKIEIKKFFLSQVKVNFKTKIE